MNLASEQIKKLISDKAIELGFIKTGFARAEILNDESQRLRDWLENGYAADMSWIEKGFDKRKDISIVLPEAKSVISLAHSYYIPIERNESLPKISRYALGKDYHIVLKEKLKVLCEFIEDISPDFKTRAYVDDGPLMDKAWAVRAGIGWMGKSTNIINEDIGSFFFLCEIITNVEFDSYDSPVEDLCGSCTLCIDACPTGAIFEDYRVDANRCISYQTIENKGNIPERINLNGWIFGCDVCQDVCPFNQTPAETNDKNFYPNEDLFNKTSDELKRIAEDEFRVMFKDSPIKRTKYKGWKRNLERISNEQNN